jgi:hypothetical protein
VSTEGGTRAIVAALAANIGIAITKFVAFLLTGSSSMLAESVHSVADSGNQALLLLGGRRARKQATPLHPFGYGRERYFWAFVVSIVLFSVGGLVAWCTWLAVRFGHPFAWIETEGSRGWNQSPGPHTWFKLAFFDHLRRSPPSAWVPLMVQALMCLAFIAAVPAVSRRFGRGYGIYVLATAVVPAISTSDFMGVGRYLLPAFPVFALVGSALEPHRLAQRIVPVLGAVTLVAGTALFASGYYLS